MKWRPFKREDKRQLTLFNPNDFELGHNKKADEVYALFKGWTYSDFCHVITIVNNKIAVEQYK